MIGRKETQCEKWGLPQKELGFSGEKEVDCSKTENRMGRGGVDVMGSFLG